MTTEIETLLRAVDEVNRWFAWSAQRPGAKDDSGFSTPIDNVALVHLRDARARHLRSTGVPSRMDIASRSVSDDKPLVADSAVAAGFNGA